MDDPLTLAVALAVVVAAVAGLGAVVVTTLVQRPREEALLARIEHLERALERLEHARASGAPAREGDARSPAAPASQVSDVATPDAPAREPARSAPGVAATDRSGVIGASGASAATRREEPSVPPSVEAALAEPLDPSTFPPPRAARHDRAPRARIDWERWLGIRGAAFAGGGVLALAGLLFVQYSIQRGWLGPAQRCVLGGVAGLVAIVASWPLRARGYALTSDAVTGAGATMLYGASWAAHSLYDLIALPPAFAAMVAITVTCGWLALRRRSPAIAVFGVVGGFATPLLLSLGSTHSLALLGYLLVLEAAVLALRRARPWSMLELLAAAATAVVFAFWVATRYRASERPLALGFCGVVAVAFAACARAERSALSRAAASIASLAPFLFAAFATGGVRAEPHVAPVAALLAVLLATAAWSTRRLGVPLALPAAIATAGTLVAWTAAIEGGTAIGWEAAIVAVALAGTAHAAAELARRAGTAPRDLLLGAAAAALGCGVPLVVGALRWSDTEPWPWLAGATALVALIHRQVALGASAWLASAAGVGVVAVFAAWTHGDGGAARPLAPWTEAAVVVGIAGVAALAAWRARARLHGAALAVGAIATCAALLAERVAPRPASEPGAVLAAAAAVACIAVAAARRPLQPGGFVLIAALAWAVATRVGLVPHETGAPLHVIALASAIGVVLAAWPALDRAALGTSAVVWRAAALAATAWRAPLALLLPLRWPNASDALPLACGALLCLALAASQWRAREARDERGARTAPAIGFVWLAALGGVLACYAIAVEVEHAITLVGTALSGAALAAVAAVARHEGARRTALAACTVAALRVPVHVGFVLANPRALTRSGYPILHWWSYETGVPALALLAAAWLLGAGARRERAIPAAGPPPLPPGPGAQLLSLAGILAAFAWINVEVINLVSEGPTYAVGLERVPVRDLALSVAWTLYALLLLVLGTRRESTALRWTSLAFFCATIGKVFLYDLGELRGLLRVGSLAGLALALLLVSVLYQRFVFRAAAAAAK